MFQGLLLPVGLGALCALALLAAACLAFRLCLRAAPRRGGATVVGFFHPYCHAGGGGERVLWVAIAGLQAWAAGRGLALEVLVYTGDAEPAEAILGRARERFGVRLAPASVRFVRLRSRAWLEAARYPRLTLLGQSLGSMACAVECLARAGCHVWVDTTGAAFTLPVAALLGGAAPAAYVHYPTVSTDMLRAVAARAPAFNNAPAIAASPLLTAGKLAYYRAFAAAYGCAGRRAARPGAVMANSSWTAAHVRQLWGAGYGRVVYPPCPTAALAAAGSAAPPAARRRAAVSLAQFRPEKNHALQLEAFALFRARGGRARKDVTLELMGGVRDEGDAARLAALRARARALGLREGREVFFTPNPPFDYVCARLADSLAGLHSMTDEHFGISCVEVQAAGCVLIAHDSGGPRSDIVVPAWRAGGRGDALGAGSSGGGGGGGGGAAYYTGCLASTVEEYAAALEAVFCGGGGGGGGSALDLDRLVAAARSSSARFSDEAFQEGFCEAVGGLVAEAAGAGIEGAGGAGAASAGAGGSRAKVAGRRRGSVKGR